MSQRPDSREIELTVGGTTRRILLDLPSRPVRSMPLLLAAHGYGGSAAQLRRDAGLLEPARSRGMAVAYLDGLPDSMGRRSFQVGYAFQDGKVDDIAFVRAVVSHCNLLFKTDGARVLATGMSNGADLSYLLARTPDSPVRAIAPIAGTMMCAWDRSAGLHPRTRVFAVHGTQDPITRWNGDILNVDGWGPYLGVDSVVAYWVNAMRLERHDRGQSGQSVRRDRWWTSRDRSEFVLTTRVGGGHDWPSHLGDARTGLADAMLDFLLG